MIADRLRAAILQAAISGKLTDQRPEDGTATELLEQIAAERAALVKAGKLKKRKPLPLVTEDEKQLSLPANWMWSRLGDVALPNPRVNGNDTEQIGFLPMASIEDGYTGRIHPQERKWSEVKSGFTKFAEGDVVMAKITPCFQNRKSAIVRRLGSQYGAGTTELHVLRPASLMEAEYLLFFLKTEYVQDELTPQMTGTAGQKRVPLGALTNLPIPVPPLAEQGRIVAKLHGVLPLIDQLAELEREREYLDREFAKAIERAILQAAISGKLTKQHPEDGTAEELLETIKTERQQLEKEGRIKKQKPLPSVYKADEPFELPGTWAYPALGEIVTLIRGITFPASAKHKESFTGAVRCLTTGSVQSRYSDSADVFVDASFVKRSDQYLSRGDAILSTANSTALVGKSIYWDEAHERTFGGFLTVARAMDSRPAATRYLHTVLRTLFLGGAFAEKSTQTTNIANLSNKILYGVRIPLPPAAEQERIVAKLDRVQPLVRSIEELVS